MYAPKFRSWMTDWDRFDEALSHRLDKMADDAMAEIHGMVEKAMPPKREDVFVNRPTFCSGAVQYGGGGCGGTGSAVGGGGFGPVGQYDYARAMSQEELRIFVHQQAALAQNMYPEGYANYGLWRGLGNALNRSP